LLQCYVIANNNNDHNYVESESLDSVQCERKCRNETVSSSTALKSISAETVAGSASTGAVVKTLVKKSNSTSAIWDYFGFESDANGFPIDNAVGLVNIFE